MAPGGNAEVPQTRLRCRPTPSRGFCRASSTASSAALPLTIRLAVVRMPSRWARTTAWLMECERPKSSALMMSRRPASRRPIVGNQRAGAEPIPGAEDKKQFLKFADARRRGVKHVELLGFEFLQQPPIDRAHQLGGAHGTAVFVGQRLARFAVELTRAVRHAA